MARAEGKLGNNLLKFIINCINFLMVMKIVYYIYQIILNTEGLDDNDYRVLIRQKNLKILSIKL